MFYRSLALSGLLSIFPILSGCYYSPDIRGQTIGTAVGTVGAGAILLHAGASITGLGAGVIAGSIIGSMVGQEYDTQRLLRLQRPVGTPIALYAYKTYRPIITLQCFGPGQIILPSPIPQTGVNCAQQQ